MGAHVHGLRPLSRRLRRRRARVFRHRAAAHVARQHDEAVKAVAGDVKTLVTRRTAMIDHFGKMGVKPDAILRLLGRKGVDDGALLLVAKDDRALRIEVGYGLEGALNDATAKRIIAEIIAGIESA